MNRTAKSAIIFVITLLVLIGIFWILLPVLGIAEIFGPGYFIVAIIGSFLISGFVSRAVARVIFKQR